MPAKLLFQTDNGAVFNIGLDPGLCFAMCLDAAKVQLTHIKQGKPDKPPGEHELTPGKWAIVQSAYEINSKVNDERIIEAQGLEIVAQIDPSDFDGDYENVASSVVEAEGVSVFSIAGDGGAHALLWVRDDENELYLFLDPNEGLWSFDDLDDAPDFIEGKLSDYDDLNETFDLYTLALS